MVASRRQRAPAASRDVSPAISTSTQTRRWARLRHAASRSSVKRASTASLEGACRTAVSCERSCSARRSRCFARHQFDQRRTRMAWVQVPNEPRAGSNRLMLLKAASSVSCTRSAASSGPQPRAIAARSSPGVCSRHSCPQPGRPAVERTAGTAAARPVPDADSPKDSEPIMPLIHRSRRIRADVQENRGWGTAPVAGPETLFPIVRSPLS